MCVIFRKICIFALQNKYLFFSEHHKHLLNRPKESIYLPEKQYQNIIT